MTATEALLSRLDDDLADLLPLRGPRVIDYAPPAVRSPVLPMPGYVEHRRDVDEIGRLTAEAVVRQYEETAKEVEAMGMELTERLKKLEATKADSLLVLEEIKETAAAYRNEGKRIFLEIEECAIMNAEARQTCSNLREKIAGPAT